MSVKPAGGHFVFNANGYEIITAIPISAALGEEIREVDCSGSSYAQIAEAMDCPIGTVRTWIHRARRELIQFLQDREVVESRYAV